MSPELRQTSDHTIRDADVCVRNVKSVSLEVVQALRRVKPWRRCVPSQLDRLKRSPGRKLRRQVLATLDLGDAEHPTWPTKNMHLHPLCSAPPTT